MADVSLGTLPTHAQVGDGMAPVRNPYTGETIGSVCLTSADAVDGVLRRARQGRETARGLSRAARAAVLDGAAGLIEERAESFARLIVAEAGKTLTQARKETGRAVNTLRLSAAEARRNAGEVVPFDAYAGSEGRSGWFTREPLGVIAAVTPYNDPLNLVAHKLGPAIAGGNAVVLKPSLLTPLSALRLVDTLVEAGLPEDVVTVVNGGAELGAAVVAAPDVRMVSFTGGFRTGEAIARSAGLKKLAMDLGGNAPVLVLADADLDAAVEACVSGAFWAAGQNCVGTQRILVERPVYEAFRDAFVERTGRLRTGDPADERTDVGPMIDERAAVAAEATVAAALAEGATLLCGHERDGSGYAPTVLEGVPATSAVWREEAFAPVVVLEPFDTFEEAVERANEIDFSLHAGVFTASLDRAMAAARLLEAGGVMINDSSDYRIDAMPFGGFKYGSMGREGVRFAYEDMTQPKVVCLNGAGV
ncbi:aldehyde dehydrogenase family protein [Streptomyces turgidiscabies]|uniref:Putative succinate-semialdehyde dehydrogenase [NAD(P)+] n=1 Tax=Streptomyces turgidiscabies (strain Car8) TaxID=698760 RepID=L7F6V9_STRT8|nr:MULTISPECIES: aldehyde dehydrogenase family protein [Streptomyces]ELP66771.1 putative succinate-semialdehyde dehydrogenase [NAD(P)+] [Streptomyces turgidiscabies Car8]MDX3500041.1 aldehyde dehydrogenase family protein [Streptomyces turgidiscabies]GAQ73744.1 sulfoacetaldehyde dehydrogenase [Streptomyces turgidiscabies]